VDPEAALVAVEKRIFIVTARNRNPISLPPSPHSVVVMTECTNGNLLSVC
jgi:hypothetical protein